VDRAWARSPRGGSAMNGLRVITLFGIRVILHPSWFVIFALLVAWLGYADPSISRLGPVGRWSVALFASVLFFGSVLAHELAHALVARRRGLVIKEITLFFFGGAASLEREAPTARTEFLVAIVGPLTSGAVGVLFLVVTVVVSGMPGVWADVTQSTAFWLGASNVLLCIFNLFPGFPMDGGRVVRAIAWGVTKDFVRATKFASVVGRITGQLIVLAGLLLALSGGAGAIINGIWLVLIGWFVSRAASWSYRHAALERLLDGVSVGDIMETNVPVIGPNLTLDVIDEHATQAGQTGFFAVVADGALIGTIDAVQIRRVSRGRRTTTRVGEVMSRGDAIVTLTVPQPIMEAIDRFERSAAAAFPVVDVQNTRQLLGMLTRDGLLHALQARARSRADAPSA